MAAPTTPSAPLTVEEACAKVFGSGESAVAKGPVKLSLEESTAHLIAQCEDNLGKDRVDNWVWAVNDELGGRGKKKVRQSDIESFADARFLCELPFLDYHEPETREAISVVLRHGHLSEVGTPEDEDEEDEQ